MDAEQDSLSRWTTAGALASLVAAVGVGLMVLLL